VIRAHQPGSEPIDIPETIPNPVVVPKPTPIPTEPPPKEPVRIPEKVPLRGDHLGRFLQRLRPNPVHFRAPGASPSGHPDTRTAPSRTPALQIRRFAGAHHQMAMATAHASGATTRPR
jgi:hypothetical protein